MTRRAEGTLSDFHSLWGTIPNQLEVETTSTFQTIGQAFVGDESDLGELPRVDHLLALGEVLGFGGNGEVVAAVQTSLHRTIAVKRPRRAGGTVGDRLLREARVIGLLEHPNIPPVHFVGSGARDALLVGLKRIEGETLTAKLERERPLDNLDENLDILVHVCNAIGYAHSRGILHLDIKPDNIMTGYFGEVYVLDWGLAAAYRDDVGADIARIGGDRTVRGTPAFLAPEMITAEGISPATDVYLLGGLLHYVLTHEPPNAGDSAVAAMQSAYEPRERHFAERVPAGLADICRRALSFDPRDRYADADQLRAAVSEFRRERQERDARDIAQRQLGQLSEALRTARDDAAIVYQAYGAARQALDAAARLQPDDSMTRTMLQVLLEPMVEWEIDRENLGGAELLLSELPARVVALEAAVERLREDRESAREELSALRREVDPNVGSAGKVLLAMGVGITVAALEVVPFLLDIPPTTTRVLLGYLVYIAVLTVLTLLNRKPLLQTRTNRGLTLAIWLLSLYGLALRTGAYFDLMPPETALGYDLSLVTLVGTYAGLFLDRRTLVSVPFYLVATIVVFNAPKLAFVAFGLSHFVGLTAISIAMTHGSTRSTA